MRTYLGQVYGSDATRASHLRSYVDGSLRLVEGMLPRNTGGLPNDNESKYFPDAELFLAGGGQSPVQVVALLCFALLCFHRFSK
jgi:hypothetical protein